MNKLEWMPEYPCPCGCIRYPDSHKCNAEDDSCIALAEYQGGIKYQKKLLEYQIKAKPCQSYTGDTMTEMKGYKVKEYVDLFELMLKQLDILNDRK